MSSAPHFFSLAHCCKRAPFTPCVYSINQIEAIKHIIIAFLLVKIKVKSIETAWKMSEVEQKEIVDEAEENGLKEDENDDKIANGDEKTAQEKKKKKKKAKKPSSEYDCKRSSITQIKTTKKRKHFQFRFSPNRISRSERRASWECEWCKRGRCWWWWCRCRWRRRWWGGRWGSRRRRNRCGKKEEEEEKQK